MRVLVRCSYEIEVELDEKENPFFVIEENGCPGTGRVGSALTKHMEDCGARYICWSCSLNGKNEIISIDGVEVKKNKLNYKDVM